MFQIHVLNGCVFCLFLFRYRLKMFMLLLEALPWLEPETIYIMSASVTVNM